MLRPSHTMDEVLLVVPTLDERGVLEALVEAVFAAAPDIRILIVDDSSPDGTGELCRSLMESYPRLQLLERGGERGLGRAYAAGLKAGIAAGHVIIGTMDADLSHDPVRLPAMLKETQTADVVIGSRYTAGGATVNWGWFRRRLSWTANRFAAGLLGLRHRDLTSGFRLYRASALERVDLDALRSTGYSFLVELLFRLVATGAKVTEVPIRFFDRRVGRSKLSTMEIPRGVFQLLRLRSAARRPVGAPTGDAPDD